MLFSVPEPDIISFKVERILEEGGQIDDSTDQKRLMREKIDEKAFKSLHKIAKLPKGLDPKEWKKVCSYQPLKE